MIGNKVILIDEVDSTNRFASQLLESAEFPEEGTVVRANFQEKGRGQRDAIWESEKKQNLLCSIILYPVFLPVQNQFLMNQMVSLAVAEFIEETTRVEAKVKWPNDILVNERKIAGILIENNLKGSTISSSILGIGINVNQLVFRNFGYVACSLSSLTGKTFDVSLISYMFFQKLDFYYQKMIRKEYHSILEMYSSRLFRLDIPSMYEIKGKSIKAIIRGVRPQGDLILEIDDGEIRFMQTREIRYLF